MSDEPEKPVTCHFCPASVPDVDAAIEAGWEPYWYDPVARSETGGPVCPKCTAEKLVWSDGHHNLLLKQ